MTIVCGCSINEEADPTGIKTYRNAVTNSLFLELRLYDMLSNPLFNSKIFKIK